MKDSDWIIAILIVLVVMLAFPVTIGSKLPQTKRLNRE